MHRSHGKGSYLIDRRFGPVGRILRASGTTDRRLFNNLNHMLDTLAQGGRYDVLEQLRDGRLTPLEVWRHYRLGRWDDVPTVQHLQPLLETLHRWALEYPCSEEHRTKNLFRSLKAITPLVRAGATIAELPEVLAAFRRSCVERETHRTFNVVRAALQAFLRSSVGRHDPLYGLVSGIDPLGVAAKFRKHPLTVEQARAVTATLGARHGPTWWAMCVTGMGPKEFWGRWDIEGGRVRIYGTKRAGRNRVVPLFSSIVRPTTSRGAFVTALKRACVDVTPYDARRTFANWLEGAGIPRTRRKLYLGHGVRDVTDLYERHEVEQFLADDAARLRGFCGEIALRLVKA